MGAAPNILLSLFGGIIVDKIGVRITLLCFCSLMVIGMTLASIGGYYNSYLIILFGRIFHCIGADNT